MYLTRKHLITLLITFVIILFLNFYRLDYYVYQPGDIRALEGVVTVEDGYESDGEMHLVTVRGGQATPLYYLWALIRPYHEIRDLEDVRPDGISQDEYMEAQLQFMESSQEAATVVAFQAAGEDITIDYQGAYIALVVEDLPADGVLEVGDQIIEIDGEPIEAAEEVVAFTSEKSAGETIDISVLRNEETLSFTIPLAPLGDGEDRVGIGVSLVTDREVTFSRDVDYQSGQIGGPSAGLIFALEVYDQLLPEDVTKGYQIVATGEIDYEGNVYPIGGIDKKIVAADRENADIFFAPNEGGREGSNYEIARQTAEEIGTDMAVIPVDTFQDALNYLERIPAKSGS